MIGFSCSCRFHMSITLNGESAQVDIPGLCAKQEWRRIWTVKIRRYFDFYLNDVYIFSIVSLLRHCYDIRFQ